MDDSVASTGSLHRSCERGPISRGGQYHRNRYQSIALSAELIAARIAAELAAEILALKNHLELVDEEIEQRSLDRPEVEVPAR
jgi:hypothetical protein